MTVSLKHTTQATGTDAGNGEIGKSQWNEEHTLTMASGKLLGRSTAGTGAAEEITVGTGLSLSGGTLTSSGGAAAGSSGEIQFNDGGAFGADELIRAYNDPANVALRSGTVYSTTINYAFSEIYSSQGDNWCGHYAAAGNDSYEAILDCGASGGTFGGYIYFYGKNKNTGSYGNLVLNIADPGVSGYNFALTLPTSAGSSGQALTTDGSGVLSWTEPAKSSPPATTTSTGRAGEIRYDSDFVYVCVASNSWKRAALSTW